MLSIVGGDWADGMIEKCFSLSIQEIRKNDKEI